MSIAGSAPPRTRAATGAARDDHLGRRWRAELADFRRFRERSPDGAYPDWRPAAWQALGHGIGDALEHAAAVGAAPRTALELGCGGAGTLLRLIGHGLVGMGVDRDPTALELAARVASTLRPFSDPVWCLDDFLRPGFAEVMPPADLVVTAGVLEWFDPAGQAEVFGVQAALSNRWVLVVTANVDSPLFRSSPAWTGREGRDYCQGPTGVDVPALAHAAGYRLVATDGQQVFLDRPEWYARGHQHLDAFCARMRHLLVTEGGARFGTFPELELTAGDIAVLDRVERSLSRTDRLRHALARRYLVDVG